MRKYNVCIVGAGFISSVHLEVLQSLPNVDIKGIYDVNKIQADSMANQWGIKRVYTSLEEVIKDGSCDAVHVLVPPNFHAKVAESLLKAGINVFLEKPMATSNEECNQLIDAARKGGAKLGINHNLIYHPAFLKCKKILREGQLGNIHHIIHHWNVPLRQLTMKQFSHWMFQSPKNIILEQAVHPLSQIYDLIGKPTEIETTISGKHKISPGKEFFDSWQISMVHKNATAQLFLSFGQNFSTSAMSIICDDGVINIDFTNNIFFIRRKTKWPEFFDSYLNGKRSGKQLIKQSFNNAKNYILSLAKLKSRSDTFFVSMKNSISSFYSGLDTGELTVDVKAGSDVIEICEQITKNIPAIETGKKSLNQNLNAKFDAVIIGGAGFIGSKVVKKMIEAKKRVLVVDRNANTLPALFYNPLVTVVSGDITNKDQMRQIIKNIPVVIHLAPGGGDTWEAIKSTMVAGTKNVAEACMESNVKKLIYVSSIAALYLGNKRAIVTGATNRDVLTDKRSFYSKGKALCEDILNKLYKEKGLPVCILRPGIVVGEGGLPFHSGLGYFNNDIYCLGWNKGKNPLPFVLVEDVAESICLSAFSDRSSGKTYNLSGDVNLTAREYIRELGIAMNRRIRYVPQSPIKLQLIEILKWMVKKFIQRRNVPFPSYRDLKSRGILSKIDSSDLKKDLNWHPVKNKIDFIKKGIFVHGEDIIK